MWASGSFATSFRLLLPVPSFVSNVLLMLLEQKTTTHVVYISLPTNSGIAPRQYSPCWLYKISKGLDDKAPAVLYQLTSFKVKALRPSAS